MQAPSLVESILERSRLTPDAPALTWGRGDVTYGRLAALAAGAHARLARPDLATGDLGVLARKSPDAIALLLACLRANRPVLLPSFELGRVALAELFGRAGCRHVLCTPRDLPAGGEEAGPLAGLLRRIDLDALEGAVAPALAAARAGDTALMLTTSGSTGVPKIVPLPAGAIDRFTDWAGARFEIGPGTTVLNYAPLNFDLSLLDVWTTFKFGGRVVLVDQDQAVNPRYLLGLLRAHDVGVVQAVPMLFRLLLEHAGADTTFPTVRHVIFTGDAMPPALASRLPELFPNARLCNVYGCTETNDSFLHELDSGRRRDDGPLPIGRPLPGVSAVLVDGDGAVVDGPGRGELLVSTPFQSGGYLDGGGNGERFVWRPDGRVYFRSGDLVERRANGELVLLGRTDFQVKVRGVRVNLQEIERVLLEHDQVSEVAVVALPDEAAGKRLTALVRRRAAAGLSSLHLRQHCAQRLPRAAIPSVIELTDGPLPRTATGKVDRRGIQLSLARRG